MQGRTEGPWVEFVSSKQRDLQLGNKMRTAKTRCPAMTFLLRKMFFPGSKILSAMPSKISLYFLVASEARAGKNPALDFRAEIFFSGCAFRKTCLVIASRTGFGIKG